jgi:hypothetical protein
MQDQFREYKCKVEPVFAVDDPSGRSLALRCGYSPLGYGVAGLNLTRGINVCPRISVFLCPVMVNTLRRADLSANKSYQM